MKTCVIIPAFNEAENIKPVLEKIKRIDADIIVIDDGSGDDTASVSRAVGAFVISHKQNMGKGTSIREGFRYALEKDYDFIVTMDGDGQHDPLEIPLFIKKALESGTAVIAGNRLLDPSGMPLTRKATNRFMSFIISAICRQHIPDSQCGFRLYSKDAIASIDISTKRFEIDSEILIRLSRKGFRIDCVPVKSIYGREKSQIKPIIDTLRFIRFVAKALREQ